jgi:competence protein ComEC
MLWKASSAAARGERELADTEEIVSVRTRRRIALPDPVRLLEAERDRWFLWLPVLFAGGIALYMGLATEPPFAAAVMPAVAAIALHYAIRRGWLAIPVTLALAAVAMGFAVAKLKTEWVEAPILERQLRQVEIAGFVEKVEPRESRGPRVTVAVRSFGELVPELKPVRVRVRFLRPVSELAPGQPIRFRATLAPPARPALPGDFDFARTAFYQGIGAVGFAMSAPRPAPELGQPPAMLAWRAWIERRRQEIGNRIRDAVSGETGGLANALMTGERGGISRETMDAYRDAGLLHILAISGLHMAIMAGSVYFFLRLLLAAIPAIALRYPIKKWAALGAAVAALAYLMISGMSFATIRAFIMILVMLLAVLLDRPALSLRNVAIAALAILVVVPESLFNVGFQMSFAAVVALVAAYEAWNDRRRIRPQVPSSWNGPLRSFALFMAGIVATTIVASVAVAPFAAYHFHQSQQLAVLANLIAVPVCNFIVMPAALAAFVAMPFGLEAVPLWIMGNGIDAMTWTAKAVASIPGAVSRVPAFPAHAFGLMVIGGLWLSIWRRRWRLLGLAAIAAGVAAAPFNSRPDALVGREGQLVAVRGADGRLAALQGRTGGYELRRWLDHDGDASSIHDARSREIYRCDAAGCTATLRGEVLLAVARHPSALADDCLRASVLVLAFTRPGGCDPKGPVIDFFALRDGGTHALFVESGGSVKIRTVAEARGARPWSLRRSRKKRSDGASRPKARTSAHRFTTVPGPDAPSDEDQWRPEIEDDRGFEWSQ